MQIIDEFRRRHLLKVDSARICYSTVGSGPPLVLLHGYPLSGQTWRLLIPTLAGRFTCYAFDLIGFGHSSSPDPFHFSSIGQAQVVQQALAALGVPAYSLLANDSGGWIARELALLEPHRVTRLVMTNTEIPDHRPPWISFYQRLSHIPGGEPLFQRMVASRRWRRSSMGFGGCFQNLALIDGEFGREFLVPLVASRQRISNALQFLARMKFERVDRFKELHRQLTMPVGLVWGSADPTFPEALARPMGTQFPNLIGFTTVPAGKLFMHEEMPDAVIGPVTDFLTRTSA